MSMKKMLAVVAAVSLVAAPAFAANPFSDVPMNHWAYDAVEQLSAKGILEGYPNGTFKGNKSMTRYEIATMVARMMANGGASGADLEKLKALVVEFQPELEALGVKVDGFDARIAKLEKNLGGLKLWGQMRFDYRAWDDQATSPKKNGFNFNRARLFARKELSDGLVWEMRWHNDTIDRWWLTMKNAFGVKGLTAKLGQFSHCWETEDGLQSSNHWWDDDANFYDTGIRGGQLIYKQGGLTLDGFVASNKGGNVYADNGANEFYGARVKYGAEKFFVAANLYAFNESDSGNRNYKAYWFSAGVKPLKGLDLRGAYYMEKIDAGYLDAENDDPKAYKVVLSLDKSLLKFTDLRAEYTKYDKGFIMQQGGQPYSVDTNGHANINAMGDKAISEDLKVIKLAAVQKWTKKWSTYERWGQFDLDGVGNGKAKEWTLGVAYQYSPALQFSLSYTDFDGRVKKGVYDGDYDNKMIRFRTLLNF